MFPGIGGLNPKKMQGMLKQMGINQEEIEAEQVIIKKSDGDITINNPSVQKITMQGQESYQISGEISQSEPEQKITEEDIKLVAEKTSRTLEEARSALEETKDIAEAIIKLNG